MKLCKLVDDCFGADASLNTPTNGTCGPGGGGCQGALESGDVDEGWVPGEEKGAIRGGPICNRIDAGVHVRKSRARKSF